MVVRGHLAPDTLVGLCREQDRGRMEERGGGRRGRVMEKQKRGWMEQAKMEVELGEWEAAFLPLSILTLVLMGTEGRPGYSSLTSTLPPIGTGWWGPLPGCTQRHYRRRCHEVSWPRSCSSSSALWRTIGAILCASQSSQPSVWACLQSVPTVRAPGCGQWAGSRLLFLVLSAWMGEARCSDSGSGLCVLGYADLPISGPRLCLCLTTHGH